MGNKENVFFEICRIRIARELNVPPDNIDIIPLINCCKRAIIEQCGSKEDNGAVINPLTEEEKEAVLSEYGSIIISRIFARETPFNDWVEIFEDDFAREFLEKINRKKFNKE